MKVKCPECKENFEFDSNEYDAEDSLECPKCAECLIVKVKNGQFILKTEKEDAYSKYMDEDDEDY